MHADGALERLRQTILEQRAQMFILREYRMSRHSLSAGTIRFIGPGLALVTAAWELSSVYDSNRKVLPPTGGQCTLVVRKVAVEGWRIVSLRYARHTKGDPPAMTHAPGVVPGRFAFAEAGVSH